MAIHRKLGAARLLVHVGIACLGLAEAVLANPVDALNGRPMELVHRLARWVDEALLLAHEERRLKLGVVHLLDGGHHDGVVVIRLLIQVHEALALMKERVTVLQHLAYELAALLTVQLGFLLGRLTRRFDRRLDLLLLLLGLDARFLSTCAAVCLGAILVAREWARVATRQHPHARLRTLLLVFLLEAHANTIVAAGAEAEADLAMALEHRLWDVTSRPTGMATAEAEADNLLALLLFLWLIAPTICAVPAGGVVELHDLAALASIVRIIAVGKELRMAPANLARMLLAPHHGSTRRHAQPPTPIQDLGQLVCYRVAIGWGRLLARAQEDWRRVLVARALQWDVGADETLTAHVEQELIPSCQRGRRVPSFRLPFRAFAQMGSIAHKDHCTARARRGDHETILNVEVADAGHSRVIGVAYRANQRHDDHVVLIALELIDGADIHTLVVLVPKEVAKRLDLRGVCGNDRHLLRAGALCNDERRKLLDHCSFASILAAALRLLWELMGPKEHRVLQALRHLVPLDTRMALEDRVDRLEQRDKLWAHAALRVERSRKQAVVRKPLEERDVKALVLDEIEVFDPWTQLLVVTNEDEMLHRIEQDSKQLRLEQLGRLFDNQDGRAQSGQRLHVERRARARHADQIGALEDIRLALFFHLEQVFARRIVLCGRLLELVLEHIDTRLHVRVQE